jgi:membrane protein
MHGEQPTASPTSQHRAVPDDSRSIVQLVKSAFSDFGEDECGLRAAALAYFTVFSLPPLLILLVMIAGTIWSPQEVQRSLESQLSGMMGEAGGRQIHEMLVRGAQAKSGLGAITSVAGLLLGATGFFLNLQGALNRVWEVKPDPEQGGFKAFIGKRVLSFGMLLGIGLLLAVSLALTAAISALGGVIGPSIPKPVMFAITFVVDFVVLSSLFAALFKYLPDAEVAWRDVGVGGVATGLLFVAGKFAIGLYLGRSDPGDAFGAASALAVLLVWTYYAGMIVLFGAEFTQQWAVRRGAGIRPEPGAVRVIETEQVLRPGQHQGDRAAATDRAANAGRASATPARRSGLVDYLVGLPIIVLLLRRRGR